MPLSLCSTAFPDLENSRGQNGATVQPVRELNGYSRQNGSRSWTEQRKSQAFRRSRDPEPSREADKSIGEQKQVPWGQPDSRFDQTIALFNPIRYDLPVFDRFSSTSLSNTQSRTERSTGSSRWPSLITPQVYTVKCMQDS